jgi:hypothetical protein
MLVTERARTHARTQAQTHTETEYVETSGYFCVKFDIHVALSRGDSTDHTPEQGSCGESSLVYLILRNVLEVPTTTHDLAPSVGTSRHTTQGLPCNISRFFFLDNLHSVLDNQMDCCALSLLLLIPWIIVLESLVI